MINLRLIFCIILLLAATVAAGDLRAQDVKAMPVQEVEAEQIPVLGKAPVLIELFSSQACVFCPRADRLFADLLKQDNVIGLACHVDYFDVTEGSLARPFCTQRQNFYMQALAAGPNYTPQIVINGERDVIGYKFDKVISTLQAANYSEIKLLPLAETDARGTWKVTLPLEEIAVPKDRLKLWLALYDNPHDLTIAEGRNKGRKAAYYNIVSALGSTDEINPEVFVTPPMESGHAGFVLMLQDMETGRIYGVARHKKDIAGN